MSTEIWIDFMRIKTKGGLAMDDILSMIMEFEKQGYTKEQIEAITGYKLEELK